MIRQAFGIVSLLNIENNQAARLIWNRASDMVQNFGFTAPEFPHFSWQVAVNYQLEQLAEDLQRVALETEPFSIHIAGLGIFPGIQPVLYLSIVRSKKMNLLHEKIWRTCSIHGFELSAYYSPERWIPHLTLAYDPILSPKLSLMVEAMASEP